MARILWHVTSSLDGFIAPPDDSTDWMFGFGRAGVAGRTAMERTTAILAGRRGYDLSEQTDGDERRTYGGAWSGPMVILTHRPPQTPPDGDVTFVTSLEKGVEVARRAAGDGDVGVFGADVARQLLRAGLIDDIVVHLLPILLGAGVRLFDSAGPPIRLRKTSSEDVGQIVDLTFEVEKPEVGTPA
jgi:dihydrofolate reductase